MYRRSALLIVVIALTSPFAAGIDRPLRGQAERLAAETAITRPGPPPPDARKYLADRPIEILPYTGGYPRLTHDESCVDPINDHKLQVNLPWKDGGYVIVDLPEAVFSNIGLLFLGHRHDAFPTIWQKEGVKLDTVTWSKQPDGALSFMRKLPNGVSFGVTARGGRGYVDMHLWLENGTEAALNQMRAQICVLLGHAAGFDALTSDNKFVYTADAGWIDWDRAKSRPKDAGAYGVGFGRSPGQVDGPMIAVVSKDGRRCIATLWDHCLGLPANPRCPCMHSDPYLPDCPPNRRVSVDGKIFFIEGDLNAFHRALSRSASTRPAGTPLAPQ